jgi:hypothetical protein
MMKRLSLTILCCFLLSGCIFDPVFDTSSWDAYQSSSAAIKAQLSNDDLRRLDVALRYLLLDGMPKNALDGQPPAAVRDILANPYVILARLGPRINGRSAAAIIQNLSIRLDAEGREYPGIGGGDFTPVLLAKKRLFRATRHRIHGSQRRQSPALAGLFQQRSV